MELKNKIIAGATVCCLSASVAANALLYKDIQNKESEILEINKSIKGLNEKYENVNKDLKNEKEKSEYLLRQIEKLGLTPRQIEMADKVDITMTFYGEGAEENGGYAGITCNGDKLVDGIVASNVWPQGTKFYCVEENKIYTVSDRGGSNFDSYNRLDVFVPRYSGESKSEYDSRISKMGRKPVTMLKITNEY